MRFWDASAIVPLLVNEPGSSEVATIFRRDPIQIVWCLTAVEVSSALARRQRERALEDDAVETARATLRALAEAWEETIALDAVRSRAIRLLQSHPLGAADALQLAAALVASDERPEGFPFVCLDARLRDAAKREGFLVSP